MKYDDFKLSCWISDAERLNWAAEFAGSMESKATIIFRMEKFGEFDISYAKYGHFSEMSLPSALSTLKDNVTKEGALQAYENMLDKQEREFQSVITCLQHKIQQNDRNRGLFANDLENNHTFSVVHQYNDN